MRAWRLPSKDSQRFGSLCTFGSLSLRVKAGEMEGRRMNQLYSELQWNRIPDPTPPRLEMEGY